MATRSTSCSRSAACPIARSRSTSAPATQFAPEFLAISPNNKIPAIVDPDGPDGKPISLFESGAILLYLAAKTGRFLPADLRGRYRTLEWLMFQMGSIGPMLGQAHHFRLYAPEKIPYAIDRYSNEAKRLYGVLDTRLKASEYVAGDEYTIADIAIFPWLRSWQNQGIDWTDYPHAQGLVRPRSPRGRRCSAASRCSPACASRCATTRRAKSCSAPGSTSAAEPRRARAAAASLDP